MRQDEDEAERKLAVYVSASQRRVFLSLSEEPITSRDLDLMEDYLRDKLLFIEVLYEDKAEARKVLLAGIANNKRDRQIYEILLRQKASTRGSRCGNRKNITTKLRDETLLNAYAEWQKARAKSGKVRQFASWWFKHTEQKDATDKDIRRITQRLCDARKRMEDQ
jgi:hypothetical protein